jgi:hypothetical protein
MSWRSRRPPAGQREFAQAVRSLAIAGSSANRVRARREGPPAMAAASAVENG